MSEVFSCRRCLGGALLLRLFFCAPASFAQEPPEIVIEPSAVVEDQIGSVTSLSCIARGDEPIRYQWCLYGGSDRFGVILARIRNATNATFTPNYLSDTVSYICIVSNQWGAATSRVSKVSAPLWLATSRLETWRTSGSTFEIAYTNKMAFAAITTGAVEIVSFADPRQPELVARYITMGATSDVAVENGTAFLACGSRGVEVIDVTLPNRPTRRTVISQAADYLEVQNGTAYLGRYDGAKIQVVDVRMPDRPRMAGSLLAAYTDSFAVENGRLAARTAGGIRIADVSNADAPNWTGLYPTDDYGVVFGISRDLAYIAGGVIYTLSITNPAVPRVANGFGVRSACSLTDGLVVSSDWIYDVSTPQQVALVGYYQPPAVRSIVKDGNHLFGASADGTGIAVIEIGIGPPQIVSTSGNVEVVLGPDRDNQALLSVVARGAGLLRYDWFFGETGDTNRPLVNAISGAVFVWNPWISGAASPHKVWVRVSNSVGVAESETFFVTIRPTIEMRLLDGASEMIISAHANSVWMLESSSDLTSWLSLGHIRLPSGSMQVSVPVDASVDSAVFYRVRNTTEF